MTPWGIWRSGRWPGGWRASFNAATAMTPWGIGAGEYHRLERDQRLQCGHGDDTVGNCCVPVVTAANEESFNAATAMTPWGMANHQL